MSITGKIPSFISKIKSLPRPPVIITSVILAFILGPFGAFSLTYFLTSNGDFALERTTILFGSIKLPREQTLIFLFVLTFFFFYILYMTQFIRRKIEASEASFSSLLVGGDEKFHESFTLVSNIKIPIVLGIAMMILFSLQPIVMRNFQSFCFSPSCIVYVVIAYPFWFVAFMTFLWTYCTSIKGLFDLGRKRIRLLSFREDKMLGLKPFGSLSLNISYTYFISLALILLATIALVPNTPTLSYAAFLGILILIGIFFFVLPLYAIHQKMIEYKKMEQSSFQRVVGNVIGKPTNTVDQGKDEIFAIKDALSNLTNIMTLDVTKKEIESIPTWPFDSSILSRLAAIILTVTATLLANYIMKFIFKWP